MFSERPDFYFLILNRCRSSSILCRQEDVVLQLQTIVIRLLQGHDCFQAGMDVRGFLSCYKLV